ncbi:hypothetical protein PEC301645_02630 [Pectobacterium carotovorum subsp. carotovorum]|nr:hypothetical protein PEC301645_02630 [Pectobacterium carotovorum subsp. carotovorum]
MLCRGMWVRILVGVLSSSSSLYLLNTEPLGSTLPKNLSITTLLIGTGVASKSSGTVQIGYEENVLCT